MWFYECRYTAYQWVNNANRRKIMVNTIFYFPFLFEKSEKIIDKFVLCKLLSSQLKARRMDTVWLFKWPKHIEVESLLKHIPLNIFYGTLSERSHFAWDWLVLRVHDHNCWAIENNGSINSNKFVSVIDVVHGSKIYITALISLLWMYLVKSCALYSPVFPIFHSIRRIQWSLLE